MSDTSQSSRLRSVRQEDSHGCGVACLAMMAGTNYQQARDTFTSLKLAVKRRNRAPFSSNFRELMSALDAHGLKTRMERWPGWESFTGIGILKIRQSADARRKDWHWVAAEAHPEFGVAVRDPSSDLTSFHRPPVNGNFGRFEKIQPYGNWIRILPADCSLSQVTST